MFTNGGNPDSAKNGSNRTGTYAVKVKLTKKLPQLLPVMGKRISISYPGVQRLCTNCFGNHGRQSCQSKKVKWHQYIARFKEQNPDFPVTLEKYTSANESKPLTPKSVNLADSQPYLQTQAHPKAPIIVANDNTAAHDTASWVGKTIGEAHDSTTLDQITPTVASADVAMADAIAKPRSTEPRELKEPRESDFKILIRKKNTTRLSTT
jgi:hypothetical protein